ncbi:MAG: MYXO-CTERM sorting domain-containing protein, partial [Polyangiales bacterium]
DSGGCSTTARGSSPFALLALALAMLRRRRLTPPVRGDRRRG